MANLIDMKNIADDEYSATGDKRKMSSNTSPEQTNFIKKLKETKTQSDMLCKCPQKCSERVPQEFKDALFNIFEEIDNEHVQNIFVQKFIEVKPIANRLFSKDTTPNGKLLRRIHCKYRIPSIVSEDFISNIYDHFDEGSDFDETSSVASMDSKQENDKSLENDSMETSRKSLSCYNCIDICQKAFINLFGLSDKRLKTVRELLIVEARRKHMQRMVVKEENKIEVSLARNLAMNFSPFMAFFTYEDSKIIYDKLMDAICNDIYVVNNFFSNQLWKPEYINQKPYE